MASADPLPELTEPEPALESEDVVPELSLVPLDALLSSLLLPVLLLPVLLPSVAVVPDELSVAVLVDSSSACAAAAPIAIVVTTAAIASPDVTATVLRRALSRWFIGSSSVGR